MIYNLYICKSCNYLKPHLSRLERFEKKLTWCNDCQKDTSGKLIKAVDFQKVKEAKKDICKNFCECRKDFHAMNCIECCPFNNILEDN